MPETHIHFLIASRQLWPNIFGLLLLQAQGRPPDAIHILHTGNERESLLPSKRLEILAGSRLAPGVPCDRHQLASETPEAVTDLIGSISANVPRGLRTINATGGLKAIFAGIVPFFSRPDFEVLYNEIVGGWFHLWADPADPVRMRSQPLHSPPVSAAHLPALELVETQWESVPEARWRAGPLPTVGDAELVQTMSDGFAHGWQWQTLMASHPWLRHTSAGQSGFLFEALFGAIVGRFAPHPEQAVLNAALASEGVRKGVLEEIDVVVNAGSHLVLFDLKLRGKQNQAEQDVPVVDQFAKVAKACDMLGGLSARGILVRPNWTFNEELQKLAKAFRVELWDEPAMPDIVERTSRVLGWPVPESLAPVVELLHKNRATGRCFVSSHNVPQTPRGAKDAAEIDGIPGALDLYPYLQDEQKHDRPVLIKVHNAQALLVIRSQRIAPISPTKKKCNQLVFPNGVKVPVLHAARANKSRTYFLDIASLSNSAIGDLQRALLTTSSGTLVKERSVAFASTPGHQKTPPGRRPSSGGSWKESIETIVDATYLGLGPKGNTGRFQTCNRAGTVVRVIVALAEVSGLSIGTKTKLKITGFNSPHYNGTLLL